MKLSPAFTEEGRKASEARDKARAEARKIKRFEQVGPRTWKVTDEYKETEEYKAIVALDANIVWCECGLSEKFSQFFDDGNCTCGVYKHHWHCADCDGVTQIG